MLLNPGAREAGKLQAVRGPSPVRGWASSPLSRISAVAMPSSSSAPTGRSRSCATPISAVPSNQKQHHQRGQKGYSLHAPWQGPMAL
jgi:hypothetical protein